MQIAVKFNRSKYVCKILNLTRSYRGNFYPKLEMKNVHMDRGWIKYGSVYRLGEFSRIETTWKVEYLNKWTETANMERVDKGFEGEIR